MYTVVMDKLSQGTIKPGYFDPKNCKFRPITIFCFHTLVSKVSPYISMLNRRAKPQDLIILC